MILKNTCIDFSNEPVLYQSRTRPTWEGAPDWSPWENCTKDQAQDCWNCPQVHDWIYEARALYTKPVERKWVRLDTNDYEELRDVVPSTINDFVFCDMIAIISAKLKEKNT